MGSSPIAAHRLVVDSRHHVTVSIYGTLKAMRESTRGKTKGRDHYGLFFGPPLTIGPRGAIAEREVGQIYLVANRFGAGVFAHELQHFLQHWIEINGWDPVGSEWETVAHLAGDMTARFWIWFYDSFEKRSP